MSKINDSKKILLVLSANALITMVGFGSFVVTKNKETNTKANLDINTKPVCYIDGYAHIYYTSIEAALKVARADTASNIIYVMPDLGFDINITENCEIAAEDTLCLPYESTIWQDEQRDNQSDTFADQNETNVSVNRRTKVVVQNDRTIINKGTIQIGGVLGVGASNQRPTGHTVGKYAEIELGDNSTLLNYGSIYCYGYIKESSINNGSNVINYEASRLNMPFVMYDFKGGSFSNAGNNSGAFPINVYDLPNIQSELTFNYGSCLYGVSTLYANDGYVTPNDTIILSQNNGLFRLTNGSISLKFASSNYPYTTNDCTSTSVNLNKTKLIINGDISLSSLSLSLGSINLNTADFFCPIPYKYDIEVQSGTVNVQNKMKFLSGSSLTIDEGATLNINSDVIFYQKYIDDSILLPVYPKSFGKAVLINNGNLNINSNFAGFVETNLDGASINVSSGINMSVESKELLSCETGGMRWTFKNITGYGYANISDTTTPPLETDLFQLSTNAIYTSRGTWWQGQKGSSNVDEIIGNTESGCILPGTLITMSDGSCKRVEDVKQGDLVLTFNHWSGKYDVSPVLFNDVERPAKVDIINLEFSDGTTIGVVSEHGFFNLDLNEYVYINQRNYHRYLGHKFYLMGDLNNHKNYKTVTLIKEYVTAKITDVYSIVTYKHLNSFSNGLLSMPGGIEGLFNIFDLDNNMMVDRIKMKSDIEKYGLFTYDDFKHFISEEEYKAYNGKYLKVALGKNILTKEKLESLIKRYAGKF